MFGLLALILRNVHVAAIATSAVFLAFFSSEAILGQTQGFIKPRYAIVIYALLVCAALYFILRYTNDKIRFSFILNAVAVFLIALPAFDISLDLYLMYQPRQSGQNQNGQITNHEGSKSESPDIYYIILDAYAHADTLKEYFGFDNTPFYETLSSKGFYIVPESRTNYGYTITSFASSLNMRYLSDDDGLSEYAMRRTKLINLISNNEVYKFLKDRGYTTIFIGSGFFARHNFGADLSVGDLSAPFAQKGLLFSFLNSATFVGRALEKLPIFSVGPGYGDDVLYTFDRLKKIPSLNMKKPSFIFVHIVAPHPDYDAPYDLGVDCDRVPMKTDISRVYLDKLICANKKIMEVVDEILAQSSSPPIIILQSDHGQGYTNGNETVNGISINLARATLRNFTALYLPDGGQEVIPPDLTPVNLFRLIFNHYFGSDYELLEDKSYYVCELGCPDTEGKSRFFFDFTEEAKF